MSLNKKIARIVGVLFIIGTAAGILSVLFAGTILDNPDYLTSLSENRNQVIVGVLCILTMGFALTMIPVVMFPIFKKFNEALALASVVFRGVLEAIFYMGTAISWLLLLSLSQGYIKAGDIEVLSLESIGAMVMDLGDWLVVMTAIVFSIGALIIYYLFYQTKLIPRWLSIWGLAGAILYLANPILLMFGFDFGALMMPLALQEMFLAVWLIVKGFNSSAWDAYSFSSRV